MKDVIDQFKILFHALLSSAPICKSIHAHEYGNRDIRTLYSIVCLLHITHETNFQVELSNTTIL